MAKGSIMNIYEIHSKNKCEEYVVIAENIAEALKMCGLSYSDASQIRRRKLIKGVVKAFVYDTPLERVPSLRKRFS